MADPGQRGIDVNFWVIQEPAPRALVTVFDCRFVPAAGDTVVSEDGRVFTVVGRVFVLHDTVGWSAQMSVEINLEEEGQYAESQ